MSRRIRIHLCAGGALLAACGDPASAPSSEVENNEGLGGSQAVTGNDGTGGAAAGGGNVSGAGAAAVGAGGSDVTSPNLVAGAGGTPNGAAPPIVTLPPVDGVPVCARYPVRSDGLLIDFDTYDPIDGSWGESSLGQLTGGTSAYSCADDGSCPATAAIARVRTGGSGLRIQAAVPAQGYTGMVLWFGPCIDASPFGGLEFSLGGELFGASLSFKVQTHLNYPIDLANVKGACDYADEATKWSECVPPRYVINTVQSEPATVSLRWADFVEGLPNAGISADGLVGVELQFECPSDVDCAMDLRLGALRAIP